MSDFSRLMELALAAGPAKAQEAMGGLTQTLTEQMTQGEEKTATPTAAPAAATTDTRRK